jgi:homoserine O-acetyltransferase
MYFQPYENISVHDMLLSMGKDSHYRELDTMHGHDGFLIEFDKLQELLKVFF